MLFTAGNISSPDSSSAQSVDSTPVKPKSAVRSRATASPVIASDVSQDKVSSTPEELGSSSASGDVLLKSDSHLRNQSSGPKKGRAPSRKRKLLSVETEPVETLVEPKEGPIGRAAKQGLLDETKVKKVGKRRSLCKEASSPERNSVADEASAVKGPKTRRKTLANVLDPSPAEDDRAKNIKRCSKRKSLPAAVVKGKQMDEKPLSSQIGRVTRRQSVRINSVDANISADETCSPLTAASVDENRHCSPKKGASSVLKKLPASRRVTEEFQTVPAQKAMNCSSASKSPNKGDASRGVRKRSLLNSSSESDSSCSVSDGKQRKSKLCKGWKKVPKSQKSPPINSAEASLVTTSLHHE